MVRFRTERWINPHRYRCTIYKSDDFQPNENINFIISISLKVDRRLRIRYLNKFIEIDDNCIDYELLYSDINNKNSLYGIKVYHVKYYCLIFEEIIPYTVSFSDKIKCDKNFYE